MSGIYIRSRRHYPSSSQFLPHELCQEVHFVDFDNVEVDCDVLSPAVCWIFFFGPHNPYKDRLPESEDFPRSVFHCESITSCKDAADAMLCIHATRLHYTLPISVKFFFHSRDGFVIEATQQIRMLGREVQLIGPSDKKISNVTIQRCQVCGRQFNTAESFNVHREEHLIPVVLHALRYFNNASVSIEVLSARLLCNAVYHQSISTDFQITDFLIRHKLRLGIEVSEGVVYKGKLPATTCDACGRQGHTRKQCLESVTLQEVKSGPVEGAVYLTKGLRRNSTQQKSIIVIHFDFFCAQKKGILDTRQKAPSRNRCNVCHECSTFAPPLAEAYILSRSGKSHFYHLDRACAETSKGTLCEVRNFSDAKGDCWPCSQCVRKPVAQQIES